MVRVVVVLALLCTLAPLHTSGQWWWSSDDDDDAQEDVEVALEDPVVMEPEENPVVETVVEPVLKSDPKKDDSYRVEYIHPQPREDDDSYRVEYRRPVLPPRPQPRKEDDSFREKYFRPALPPRPQPRKNADSYQVDYKQPPRPQTPNRPPVISPPRPKPPDDVRHVGGGGFYDPYAPGEVVVPGETWGTVEFVIGEGGVKCDAVCRGACIIRDRQCRCMQNVTCFEMLKHRLNEPVFPIHVIPPGCPQLKKCKHACAYVVQWPDGWCLCHKDPICLQWQRRVRREKRQTVRASRKSARRAARIAKREAQRKAKREERRAKKHLKKGKSAKRTHRQT